MPVGTTQARYTIRVEDDPSQPGTHEIVVRQFGFLRELCDAPEILNCGPSRFESLTVSHSGTCWVATASAVVDELRGDR